MIVLIDILHPADLHVLRGFREEMLRRGHTVHVAARNKDVTIPLLQRYDIPAEILSRQRSGLVGLGIEWFIRAFRLIRMARRTRPHLMIGVSGPVIAPVGKLLRIPTVVMCDVEHSTRTNRLVIPLATAVVTGRSYYGPVNGHQVTYPSYHQLAYLHPQRFTPDDKLVKEAGIDPEAAYSVVRFVAWEASHDIGESGLDVENKRRLIARLAEGGRVLVSSEAPLPDDLRRFEITAEPDLLHHIIAFARIVVGESATLSSEAAVLGVPSVYIRDTGRGYTDEQERRYNLVRNVTPEDFDGIVRAVDEMLQLSACELTQSRERLLSENLYLTTWLVNFVESRSWESTVEPP